MKMVAKNPNEMNGKELIHFYRAKFSANRLVQGENFLRLRIKQEKLKIDFLWQSLKVQSFLSFPNYAISSPHTIRKLQILYKSQPHFIGQKKLFSCNYDYMNIE